MRLVRAALSGADARRYGRRMAPPLPSVPYAWRPGLARDIASYYAPRAGVAFIILGGSTARGETDAWSDLDILVYWNAVDTAWLATPPLEGPDVRRFVWRETFPGEVWLEQYFIGTQKIDVAHASLAWWERIVGDVVERGEAEGWKLGTLGGFTESLPLHGEPAWRAWCERIEPLPLAVATRMITAHLFFYPPWVIEKQGFMRGDWHAFHDVLSEAIRNLLTVLAGLNRRYFTADKLKRIGATAERMPIRPRDAGARLEALYTMERAAVPAALGTLVADTLALVETHRPDIDTARARRVFAMTLDDCVARPDFGAARG